MTEVSLEKEMIECIRRRGGWCFSFCAGGSMPAGIPDILGVYKGYFLGFEVKLPDGSYKPSFVQKETLQMIVDNQGVGGVFCSLEFLEAVLDALDRNDLLWLSKHGWQQHSKKDCLNDQWFEEVLW